MYYEHFGLDQPPFKITPDTNLFFPGGNRGAILEALIYAIVNGEGIVKVVGEVGTGKTMLCRMLEKELAENIEVVYLANPSLSPDQIPYAIAFELDLDVAASDNRLQVMNDLQDYLLKKHAENGQVVVFVEEAQAMSLDSLEELRLLSNLETGQNKLLQIVLFGQPELDEMIARPDIRQLKERITYSFQLSPFKTEEIREYINSRLRACGYRLGDAFHPSAIKAITGYSKGLLRRINILSDKALLAAYASNTHQVTAKHVRMAAKDSEFVIPANRQKLIMLALTGTILLALCWWLATSGVLKNQITFIEDDSSPVPKETLVVESKEQIRVESESELSDEMENGLAHDLQLQNQTDIEISPDQTQEIELIAEVATRWTGFDDEMPESVKTISNKKIENPIQIFDLNIFFEKSDNYQNKEKQLYQLIEKLIVDSKFNAEESALEQNCNDCESLLSKSET